AATARPNRVDVFKPTGPYATTEGIPLAAVPSGYVVGAYSTGHGEEATHIYTVRARRTRTWPNRYSVDTSVHSIIRITTQRMPLAAVPTGYVVGTCAARRREEATCVYATATDRYGVHAVIDICTHATAQGIPLTAVPACYVGGACAPCCAEITTHIYIVRA